jgi:hypothetical protein
VRSAPYIGLVTGAWHITGRNERFCNDVMSFIVTGITWIAIAVQTEV